MYQPGRPPPPLLPTPQAPYGAPDPYSTQDPYWAQGPYGQYGNHPTPRPRSFNWFVPVVVLMVFAILVAAGGAYALARCVPATTNLPATAQGAASRTPGIPAGFHAYTNATIGVRFNMPDGWTTKDDAALGQVGHQLYQAILPESPHEPRAWLAALQSRNEIEAIEIVSDAPGTLPQRVRSSKSTP